MGSTLIPLIAFVALGLVVLVATELHERKKQKDSAADNTASPPPHKEKRGEVTECCGEHLVCERETLLRTSAQPEYYDDEELDALAGLDPETYTPAQHDAIRQVFETLTEADVPGWCRSLQMRNIALPPDVREEALLIVRERRAHNV